jgi:hypothetical protein
MDIPLAKIKSATSGAAAAAATIPTLPQKILTCWWLDEGEVKHFRELHVSAPKESHFFRIF